jgi:Flp pilus assembly protein TadD
MESAPSTQIASLRHYLIGRKVYFQKVRWVLKSKDLERFERDPKEIARWQRTQQHLLAGRNGAALDGYRDLLGQYPGIAQLWFERGMAAIGALEFLEAHQAFQRMMELAPGDVSLLVLAGQQYHRMRRLDDARDCFLRAAAADPDSVHAQLSLAAWFERDRRLDDAWGCVEIALKKHPTDGHALYYRAFLLNRQGRNAEAEKELQELIQRNVWPDANVKCSAHHLLAVVLDELGRHSEALRWLCESKAQVRHLTNAAALEKQYDDLDRGRRHLLASLTPEMLQNWRRESAASPAAQRLVFLGGHPRSGTTLVEQILGAHPGVLAFDESDAFVTEIENGIAPPNQKLTLKDLNALSATDRANLRERYLKSLLREDLTGNGAAVLLDKNPSPTGSLPVWLRVFPDLKVIIPLRDPRDVVLSCFFQNLTPTAMSVNFLSLERTVKHYADLMDVWLRMRELGGFEWIETRYEDVVGDLEAEGQRLTQFMDLEWDPGQAQYHQKAKKKFVSAPTYHDVTKPVYTRAIGRWERYAEALEPFQEKLAKYCAAFGYA